MKIAIVGAESTGKTSLAAELAGVFRSRGKAVHATHEVLREWCLARGRTPHLHEQFCIALSQVREELLAAPGDIVIADTSPLMTAVYSELIFEDQSLFAMAEAHQRTYSLTLLLANDLPWEADGLLRDGPHVRQPAHALLRAALRRVEAPFAEVAGAGPARLACALGHIQRASMQLIRPTGSI